jgi:hypothetical protein
MAIYLLTFLEKNIFYYLGYLIKIIWIAIKFVLNILIKVYTFLPSLLSSTIILIIIVLIIIYKFKNKN